MHGSVCTAASAVGVSRRDLMRIALASALSSFFPGLNDAQPLPPMLLATAGAWAANKLLEQTISYVGGEIISKAFSRSSISDVKDWVQNAIAGVESSLGNLSDKIEADKMAEMTSRLESLKHQFMEYASLEAAIQPQNRFLLANCDTISAELVPLSQHYDQAFFVSSAAMGYRLATLFALYSLDKGANNTGSGHVSSLVGSGEIDKYLHKSIAARGRILHAMDPYNHVSSQCSYERSIVPLNGPTTSCQVLKSGSPPVSLGPMKWDWSLSEDEVRKETAAKVAPLWRAAWKDQDAKYVGFREQSTKQIQLVCQCFDRMYWTACNSRYQPEEVTELSRPWLRVTPASYRWIKWIK